MGRAVYRDADISLLDDCLSAVDAHVGRDLFEKCIIEVLLRKSKKDSTRKRTVILVTNALQYLSNSAISRIVVMKGGMVVESGSYHDLVHRQTSQFRTLLNAFKVSMTNDKLESTGDLVAKEIDAELDSPIQANVRKSDDKKSAIIAQRARDTEKKPQKLMTDEMAEREIGKVGRGVYLTWARAAGGLWVVVPLFVVYSAGECTTILSNWWLTYWSHNATPDTVSQLHYLGIYGFINVAAIVADFLRMFVVLFLGLQASINVSV
jgi:ABC-type sugar transport system ATPase subunit